MASWLRKKLGRVGEGIFTGGLSEVYSKDGYLNPGPNGNDTPVPGQERRSPDQLQWDPYTGMPINANGPPSNDQALAYQYRAQEIIRRRQNALWGDAANSIQQGIGLMSSYRPGGSAALASGLFQSKAGVYQNQASQLEEPDLLSVYREDKQIQADRAARRARNLQFGLGIIQAGASAAGAAAGAPAAPVGATPTVPGATPAPAAAVPGAAPGGASAPAMISTQPISSQVPGGGMQGGAPAPQYGPTTPPSIFGPDGMPGIGGATYGGGSGAAMASPGGGGGGGHGSGPGSQGRFGGGGPGAPSAGQISAAPQFGRDGSFSGTSAAMAAMASPIMQPIMMHDIATDENFQISTTLRAASARRRLNRAMA